METHYKTIIIGAGQAGLSTGYYLKELGEDFIIIDSFARVGDSWRTRWDSLRLFTPSEHDGLPGYPFPSARGTFPARDEIADYLESYSRRFNLPVSTGTTVTGLSKKNGKFDITTSAGVLTCDKVVVATGTNPVPRIPPISGEMDKKIFQIHSSAYRNPGSLPPGDVLVVGAATSGIEIALEISATHKTYIAGRPTFHIPDPLLRYGGGFYWWAISNILTVRTPVGRKVREKVRSGGSPLIRVSAKDLDASEVERLPRVTGAKEGQPQVADGRVIPVSTIIWATGYKPDFSWISIPVANGSGWPETQRGVHPEVKDLYFVGMLFQFGLTSGLIGGVGRDAGYIARYIHNGG